MYIIIYYVRHSKFFSEGTLGMEMILKDLKKQFFFAGFRSKVSIWEHHEIQTKEGNFPSNGPSKMGGLMPE